MNIRQTIKETAANIEKSQKSRTDKYKRRMLDELQTNLHKKKQTKEQNQGLIRRIVSAKPRGHNQMTLALLEAV